MKYFRKKKSFVFLFLIFLLVVATISLFFIEAQPAPALVKDIIQDAVDNPTPTPISPTPVPQSYTIPMKYHTFQSFNNCGPATLSMALSYMGITKSQEELGNDLRPYQIPGGDNDDKSVTLQEVANKAEELGLASYLRPNGTIDKLKKFISNDIPVVTRTWLEQNEDIGHYRVVRGYDDITGELVQDDSYQDKNLRYTYSSFEELWKPFNYEYLVIVTPNKKDTAERILGEELNESTAWKNAKQRIEKEREKDPSNWHLTFALSRINFYLKDYKKSVEEFNKVENLISFRTLWYQVEPILSIYQTKDYSRIMSLTEKILNNQNRAYSELYIIRGDILVEQGYTELARTEYEKAVFYNNKNKLAVQKLDSL